jgi:hypothetical protein
MRIVLAATCAYVDSSVRAHVVRTAFRVGSMSIGPHVGHRRGARGGPNKVRQLLLQKVVDGLMCAQPPPDNLKNPPNLRIELCRTCRATRATRRDMRNWRSFCFSGASAAVVSACLGQVSDRRDNRKPQVDSTVLARDMVPGGVETGRGLTPAGGVRGITARPYKLGLCGFGWGGGLDFV